jgi:hypothetical protein
MQLHAGMGMRRFERAASAPPRASSITKRPQERESSQQM